ncbi:MAG TPA: hypothetical protein VE224_16300 [Pseudolabrys sp.]|nr:hypothetical protein [Pseudolabrys sp.]
MLSLVSAALVLMLPASSQSASRPADAMQFSLRLQGPAQSCGDQCRLIVAARGPITADTPVDFKNFAKGRNLKGALVVLESNGGSVHGAIKLGREMRKAGVDTTVGQVIDLDGKGQGVKRARISPRADCESMCAFVLLAGIHRTVPDEARVLVHQIWLGDRRSDPTAADYSAEDLVLVQRDIGRLARYTSDMGASIEVLDLALRIPPWEPMHLMTRAEIKQSRVATASVGGPALAKVAANGGAASQPHPALLQKTTAQQVATTISERRWAVVDHSGIASLARSQPLTVEGEPIGSFDLLVSCGSDGHYDVSYLEHRHENSGRPLPHAVRSVRMAAGNTAADLKVVSSRHDANSGDLVTYAAGAVPASMIDGFAGMGDHSMMLETQSTGITTGIRIGNTGAQASLPQLAAVCHKGIAQRADLSLPQGAREVAAK